MDWAAAYRRALETAPPETEAERWHRERRQRVHADWHRFLARVEGRQRTNAERTEEMAIGVRLVERTDAAEAVRLGELRGGRL